MTEVITGANQPHHPDAQKFVERTPAPSRQFFTVTISGEQFGEHADALQRSSDLLRSLVGEETGYALPALRDLYGAND